MAGSGSDFIKCTVSLPFLPLCKSFAFIPNMFETDKNNQSEKGHRQVAWKICLVKWTQKPLLFCSISRLIKRGARTALCIFIFLLLTAPQCLRHSLFVLTVNQKLFPVLLKLVTKYIVNSDILFFFFFLSSLETDAIF